MLRRDIKISLQFVLLFVCLLVALVTSRTAERDTMLGTWAGEFEGHELRLNFDRDNTFQIDWTNLESGASGALTGEYRADFSKTPVPLTLMNIPQLSYPLHTSIEFRGSEPLLCLNLFAPEWRRLRAVSFADAPTMMLSRKE